MFARSDDDGSVMCTRLRLPCASSTSTPSLLTTSAATSRIVISAHKPRNSADTAQCDAVLAEQTREEWAEAHRFLRIEVLTRRRFIAIPSTTPWKGIPDHPLSLSA